MSYLGLFSMGLMISLGTRSSTWHSWLLWGELAFSLVFLLGFCVAILNAGMMMPAKWTSKLQRLKNGLTPTTAGMASSSEISGSKLSPSLSKQESSHPITRAGSGWARYYPIVFAGLCCGLMGLAVAREPKFPTSTEHHVAILRQTATNEWDMQDDEQGDFRYKGCDDFPNDTVIQPGWVADHATWEERGACRSIRATGLGFWFKSKDGTFMEVINGKRTTWTAESTAR